MLHPLFVSLIVPIAFLFLSALAKKVVRGTGWRASDFYLGVEFALAALASSLIYVAELLNTSQATNNTSSDLTVHTLRLFIFLVCCIPLLLAILAIHQDWENRAANPTGRFILLGLVCNGIGAALLSTFAILVRGVQ